ncbi:MAG: tyrosine--tRNA ligase, partial [Mycoplasmoidaceae bacterium]|nr:tyrosine--tRNA ligase [Mycoplasmoidaceae bacterium]
INKYMDILEELKLRNVINNITNEKKLKEFLDKKPGIYLGIDPSFRSIHLGNYSTLVTLKRLGMAGFKPFILIGGATGLIGDPSGKKSERVMQEVVVIENNAKALEKQIKSLIDCQVVNNYDFYKGLNFLVFLREVGKLINVNYLLEKDIIKTRLDSGISYAEFSYNLIQGYDFLKMYQDHNV